MKITLFYCKVYCYVTSFHPRLFETLISSNTLISFVDVSAVTMGKITESEIESDLLIIDQSLIWCIQKEYIKDFDFYIHLYNKKMSSAHFKTAADFLFNSKKDKFFWLQGDFHGLDVSGKDRLDGLLEYKDRIIKDVKGLIICMHPDKFEDKVDINYLDNHLLNYTNPKELVDLITRGKIVIEIPHCVNINEKISLRKKWDICVPGVLYKTRFLANMSIDKTNAKKVPFQKLNKIKYYFDASIKNIISLSSRNNIGYKFIRMLSASAKINFVCGGGYKYFVRKFVEIPLYNTAMICFPVKGLEDYGFINGKHAVFCNPENAGEVTMELLERPEYINELAKNAFNLVSEKHTVIVRAQQLIKALELLAKKELAASFFKKGEYFYERK